MTFTSNFLFTTSDITPSKKQNSDRFSTTPANIKNPYNMKSIQNETKIDQAETSSNALVVFILVQSIRFD